MDSLVAFVQKQQRVLTLLSLAGLVAGLSIVRAMT